ncbi:tetratricopeptide repeat protein [Runella sp.]|uniref:tetratricopeptide repeat protein n=1 Tax=Runella sp. TaxID=1960881 RepID=UPI003017318B
MKYNFLFLLFLMSGQLLCAQQSTIRGEASIINSQYETKTRQFVQNAQVEEDFARATPQITDAAGRFDLVVKGVKEKETITFSVKKDGLEVVNSDALSAVAGQYDLVKVYMATPQKIAEYKKQYYNIGKTSAEKVLEAKNKSLQAERQTLLADKNANKDRIAVLETQLALLEDQRSKIEKIARELASRYALINLDDASKLYQDAFRLFQEGDLDGALEVYRKANLDKQEKLVLQKEENANQKIKEGQKEQSEVATEKRQLMEARRNQADIYQIQFKWDSAMICYEALMRLDSSNYDNIFNFGLCLYHQNKYILAINLYEKCLRLALTYEQRNNLLNNLGYFYLESNRIEDAKKIINMALGGYRILNARYANAYLPEVANTMNNLGNYYFKNQSLPEAEKAFQEAFRIYRQLAENNPDAYLPEMASTLNNLGLIFSFGGDNQKMLEAEKYLKRALDTYLQLADKNLDAYLPDVAMAFNNLGIFYWKNKNVLEAEKAFMEALSIRRKLAEKNSDAFLPDVAMTLTNLGAYYFENQKKTEAEKAFIEALSIYQQLADNNPNVFMRHVAGAQNNLGALYIQNHKITEAQKALEDALSIRRHLAEKNRDAFRPDVAATLNNLGQFYETLKNYPISLDYYEEALQIRQTDILAGKTQFYESWVGVLNNIANVRDLTKTKQLYPLCVHAMLIMAVSCDSLQGINQSIKELSISEYAGVS